MNNQQAGHAGAGAHGDGQQGTGGLGNGQAAGTPDQDGKHPHLGSRPGAGSGAGGTGLSESESDSAADIAAVDRIDQAGVSGQRKPNGAAGATSDRLEDIEHADERTEQSSRERGRDIGAQSPGDPGNLLSQPLGDGNYQKQGDEQIPLNGDPDRDD